MRTLLFAAVYLFFAGINLSIAQKTYEPVTPNASPEAKALLNLYYSISGKYTFTGQHNYPANKSRSTFFMKDYTGFTPVIWSSDFGFAQRGDKDSYLSRPDIVREAIRQHKKGAIITLCWHAAPPTANEPVIFNSPVKGNPETLSTVQGHMLNEQYTELLTPGTRLYNHWAAQVDTIAFFLKQLQDAKVPVLWRPYHEMNGNWFWWGCRTGEAGTLQIYRQLFDRLVNYHKLTNLIWVWNVDRPLMPIRNFSNYYPGNDFLDILSLDVYGNDFKQTYYDSLMNLSKGKPLLFGEVGDAPVLDVYQTQPNWASWVIWAGFTSSTSKTQFAGYAANPRMLFQESKAYLAVMAPYRKACGLPALPVAPKYKIDFSGQWVLNEAKSNITGGNDDAAVSLKISQDDDLVWVKKLFSGEYGDDHFTNEDFYLDGTPLNNDTPDQSRYITASCNEAAKSITINYITKRSRDGQLTELKTTEEWLLLDGGKTLKVVQTPGNTWGNQKTMTLIYRKM